MQGDQRQVFTIQTQRHRSCAMARHLAHRRDNGFSGIQVKSQIDFANQVIRRTVVVAVFGLWLLCHRKPYASFVE